MKAFYPKTINIVHVINPVEVKNSSDLFIAQPVTFASIKNATKHKPKDYIDYNVKIVCSCYPEDANFARSYLDFAKIKYLNRSLQDVAEVPDKRKLPLLQDILNHGFEECENHDSYLLVYTNVDIALKPNFYERIAKIYSERNSPFTINRRTISKKYSKPSELHDMYLESGESHPGHDCFIIPGYCKSEINCYSSVIGANWIGRVLLCQLLAQSQKTKVLEEEYLTFHIGDDRSWKNNKTDHTSAHNEIELTKVLKNYISRDGCSNLGTLINMFNAHSRNYSKNISLLYHKEFNINEKYTIYSQDVVEHILSSAVFLVGHPRSGTTLLQQIIANGCHGVLSVPETHFFSLVWDRAFNANGHLVAKFDDLIAITKERLKLSSDLINILSKKYAQDPNILSAKYVFAMIIYDLLKQSDHDDSTILQSKILEKTPDHLINIDRITQTIQNPKIISVVRNPIKTISSRKQAFFWEHMPLQGYIDAINRSYYKHYKNVVCSRRFISLRYEDITMDVSQTCNIAANYLGIAVNNLTNNENIGSSRNITYAWENWKTKNESNSISQTTDLNLSTEEVEEIVEKCLVHMRRFGYLNSAISNATIGYLTPCYIHYRGKLPIANSINKSLLFIGHPYHTKTKSSEWFCELLKKHYKVDQISVDWKSKSNDIDDISKVSRVYDVIVFWQISPFNLAYMKQLVMRLSVARDYIFVPMLDAEGFYAPGNMLRNSNWLFHKDFKYVLFSQTLFNSLRDNCFPCIYPIQYRRRNIYKSNDVKLSKDQKPRILFVYRKPEINWALVKSLINPAQINSIHIHSIPDDDNLPLDQPSEEDISRYELTFSSWFSNFAEFRKLIDESDLVIMPRIYEGIGMLMVDCLAQGKGIIAPNTPTANEYIRNNENGYLFDPYQPSQIDLTDFARIISNSRNHNGISYETYLRQINNFELLLKRNTFRLPYYKRKTILLVFPHNLLVNPSGVKTRFISIIKNAIANGYIIDVIAFENWVDEWTDTDKAKYKNELGIRNLHLLDFKKFCIDKNLKNYSYLQNFATPALQKYISSLNKIFKYEKFIVSYAHWGYLQNSCEFPESIVFVEDALFENISSRMKLLTDKVPPNEQEITNTFYEEINRISLFDKIVYISPTEKKLFSNFCNSVNEILLTHFDESISPINKSGFSNTRNLNLGFIGSDNPFNVDAIDWFIEKVMPLVDDLNVRLTIAGPVCDHVRASNLSAHKIELLGTVDNLKEFYQKIDLSLCPKVKGTGLKIKVIESLGFGIPVLGSKDCTSGIYLPEQTTPEDIGVVICEDELEFSQQIQFLQSNPTYLNKNINKSVNYYTNVLNKKFKEEIREILRFP